MRGGHLNKNSEILQGFDIGLIIATGACTTPIIEISPPSQNPPFVVRGLLVKSYINSEILQAFDVRLIIATGARTTPIIEISPPHKTPPLETTDRSGRNSEVFSKFWGGLSATSA